MTQYVKICEDESGSGAVEVPSEPDGTILLSTIQAQCPGACGLRYKYEESNSWRGVRLAENVLYPPFEDGWGNLDYVVVPSKTVVTDVSSKRKIEESPSGREPDMKMTKVENLGDLIILGLPWKTTDEELRQYFSQYGELDMSEVKKNPLSGQSRGFGFIRFKTDEAAKNAMIHKHTIQGRNIEVRLPRAKDDLPKKLFVGRMTADTSEQDLRDYFEKFGEVSDVYIPQPYRKFSFITFASGEVAKAVQSQNHRLKGSLLNVTYAEPKGNQGQMGNMFNAYSGWGGGGAGARGANMYGMPGWSSPKGMGGQSPYNAAAAAAAYSSMYNMMQSQQAGRNSQMSRK